MTGLGRQFPELVDRPVVIGVAAVFARQDSPVRPDQEVCRQTERALARPGQGHAVVQQATRGCGPGPRVEYGEDRGLDSERLVERFRRISDQCERKRRAMFQQRLSRGMEHRDFLDAVGGKLADSLRKAVEVEVADGAAGKASELQVG